MEQRFANSDYDLIKTTLKMIFLYQNTKIKQTFLLRNPRNLYINIIRNPKKPLC